MIEDKAVCSKPSTTYSRPAGVDKKIPTSVGVHYLYKSGKLEGGRRRATDPIWSLKVFGIEKAVSEPNEPVLYYSSDGPKRWFVREDLLVVPPGTELPRANV